MTFVAKVRHNLYRLGLTNLLAVIYMLTQQGWGFFLQARQDWLCCKYYYHTKK